MPISEKNLKILWSRAAGRCSFPLCNTTLIQEGTENDAPAVVGEIAHIVARHLEGPRGREPFQGKDRDILENLILLCPVHHTIIDQQPQTYTVEMLIQMKNQHEQYVKAQLDLYNRISSPIPHYQIHNTAPIQGIAIGDHNTNTYNYYRPMDTDTQQSNKTVKQERLRNLYSKILYCARVHHRVLHESIAVMEGETLESRNARHARELNTSKLGLERIVSDLELEQPEASEVLPIFNTLLDACNEYANFLYYNRIAANSLSYEVRQAKMREADTAYSQLKDICVKHLVLCQKDSFRYAFAFGKANGQSKTDLNRAISPSI
jgi:hypothetical protein